MGQVDCELLANAYQHTYNLTSVSAVQGLSQVARPLKTVKSRGNLQASSMCCHGFFFNGTLHEMELNLVSSMLTLLPKG